MPAQKRPLETTPPPQPPPEEAEDIDDSIQNYHHHDDEEAENGDDFDESSSSSDEEYDEYVVVRLAELRKEVQCPICLGIIKKTRTVMECLHRFCRECIDKSMRLGNNECPSCRTHCASRRSLRDDPNYDALIAALYPDIDKYEKEELAFHEEEKARNKQIQDSIAQILKRQSEALGKKRASARAAAAAFIRRQGIYRNLRGRRNHRVDDHQRSDNEGANGHDGSKDSSSADEQYADVKPKRYRRRRGARKQPSSEDNADAGSDDNVSEMKRELSSASVGLGGNLEIFAWGRGAMRSHTRHSGPNGTSSKRSMNSHTSELLDFLSCSDEKKGALNINISLVSLHEDKIPSLQRPYLRCSLRTSIKQLCQYVAMQISKEASEIEMSVVKDIHNTNNNSTVKKESETLNPRYDELYLLAEDQTLGEIYASFTHENLILAYQQKVQGA